MPHNPPEGMPRVVPYVLYADVGAATLFAEQVFGFEPRFIMPDEEGLPVHAEMATPGGGVVMLGRAGVRPGTASPAVLGGVTQTLYVFVDDIDAHHARVLAAGGRVTAPPSDMFWGDRIFTMLDGEDHQWTFAQHLRDVPASEMYPPGGW